MISGEAEIIDFAVANRSKINEPKALIFFALLSSYQEKLTNMHF
jgi:hypothetical protein